MDMRSSSIYMQQVSAQGALVDMRCLTPINPGKTFGPVRSLDSQAYAHHFVGSVFSTSQKQAYTTDKDTAIFECCAYF